MKTAGFLRMEDAPRCILSLPSARDSDHPRALQYDEAAAVLISRICMSERMPGLSCLSFPFPPCLCTAALP